jgi:hypothetical protein
MEQPGLPRKITKERCPFSCKSPEMVPFSVREKARVTSSSYQDLWDMLPGPCSYISLASFHSFFPYSLDFDYTGFLKI